MPVYVRRFVAQAGQVDFIRLQHFPHRGFYCKYRFHQPLALRRRQIAHFLDVCNQFNAAISRVIGVIQQHHAAKSILPQDLMRCRQTKCAALQEASYEAASMRSSVSLASSASCLGTLIWLTTLPSARFSSVQAKCCGSMRAMVEHSHTTWLIN